MPFRRLSAVSLKLELPISEESESDPRDARLAEILEELIARLQRGDPVEIEQYVSANPDLAEELRELWATVALAEAVGGSDSTWGPGRMEASPAGLPLPCRFGDYELLEELGRGGMGVVYKARQLSLRRLVAVKMILRGPLASEGDRERFAAEAQAAGRIDHPGIVPVYEVGEHEGRPYFCMKFVEGDTLATRLAEGPLEPREAARILSEVARAIDFAHHQGVLHRDLKPSNILLDAAGRAHVTDFGLAKQLADPQNLTRTGAVLGTPTYMAPEQAAGARGEMGPATDVYSLGSILYHMLTGRPPFQASSPVDTLLLVLEQDPAPPRMINPTVDRDLEMIALRCLQKPPDLRYATAAGLADDLDAYLHDEPISARSGRFGQIVARVFRETHHAPVLENWGLLWMWHSLALLVACLATNMLYWYGVENRIYYFALWTAGLGAWAAVFWALRNQRGPVTFVERQIAHLWAGSMLCIALLFPLEWWLDRPVLELAPVLGLVNGMVFLVKGGILSGEFYIGAAALFLSAVAMAVWPDYAHIIFGVVSAACFFFPGLKYWRQSRRRD